MTAIALTTNQLNFVTLLLYNSETTLRYFIEFAYKGTNYHGWQYQPNAASVQETLNKALSVILGIDIDVVGAGRTDAGVHAKQMFAHFDLDSAIDNDTLVYKLNSYLPKDIAVFRFIPLHNEAHARFDATQRTYEYHIHTFKDAFESDSSWQHTLPLDLEKMNAAAKLLFNHTDFESFSKVNTDVGTFNCRIFAAQWTEQNGRLVFTISADRFLRNMVRAIVGTLVNVGQGKISLDEFNTIIESKDRGKAGFSVPAHGLYLTEIKYEYL